MKITICFRSNEFSNNIISSTRHKVSKSKIDKFIDIEYLNLDKRNLKKYLSSESKPNVIYMFFDEENNIDYIKKNHPEIQLETFNDKNWINLSDEVIGKFKNESGEIEYCEANIYTGKVEKCNVTNFDYQNKSNKDKHFKTKELAEEYLIKYYKHEIAINEQMIKNCKERLSKYKKFLKELDK